MPNLGDDELLARLRQFAANHPKFLARARLPTAAQLAALNRFAASCDEEDVVSLLSSLMAKIEGWAPPTQAEGMSVGPPTIAPIYQVLFTRTP